MSISDRLDQIAERHGDVTIGEATRSRLLALDVPDMLAALRAVLDAHMEYPASGKCTECSVAPYSVHSVPWPCPTVRAVTAALGEES